MYPLLSSGTFTSSLSLGLESIHACPTDLGLAFWPTFKPEPACAAWVHCIRPNALIFASAQLYDGLTERFLPT